MTLRARLLLAQVPVLLATALTIVVALLAARRLGGEPATLIDENFRSFDAARAMQAALGQLDAELTRANQVGEQPDAGRLATARREFEEPLALQRSNITEPGEDLATAELDAAWTRYREAIDEPIDPAQLDRRSHDLRAAIEVIFAINRAGMRSKAEAARDEARRETVVIALVGLLGLALALPLGALLIRQTLRPIRVLAASVARLARDDFEVRVRVETGPREILALAEAFNALAQRLAAYRACSLGDLLEANQRLQAVVDSLPDAVLVCDLAGTITQRNAAAERSLGPAGQLGAIEPPLGPRLEDSLATVVRSRRPLEAVGMTDAIELPRGPSRGEVSWLMIGATPIFREGRLVGVTLGLRDVTRVRRLEGYRSDLVASALAQVRQPLLDIHTALHLCVERAAGPIDERALDLLVAARSECERLETVLDELLELARLDTLALAPDDAPPSRAPLS